MDQGLDFSSYFYWISVGALIGFILLFNAGFAIGLTIKNRKFLTFIKLNNLNTSTIKLSINHMLEKNNIGGGANISPFRRRCCFLCSYLP
jgi:hypothetical protein